MRRGKINNVHRYYCAGAKRLDPRSIDHVARDFRDPWRRNHSIPVRNQFLKFTLSLLRSVYDDSIEFLLGCGVGYGSFPDLGLVKYG